MTMWVIIRAAGIGAYLMLFFSVAWGLIGTTSLFGKRISKPNSILVHQFASTVGLILLAVHMAVLFLDTFMEFGLADLFVPMASAFRPVAITFGIVAMYATVVVLSSSWTRKYYSARWWRAIHLLAAPAFALALVHGVLAGTDTSRPWMWWIYVVTGSLTFFLIVLRGLTVGFRPARTPRPERTARPQGSPTTAPPATAHERTPASTAAGARADGSH